MTSLPLRIDQVEAILRLIDYRITNLKMTQSFHPDQPILDEVVYIVKLRKHVQEHLDYLNQKGC